MSFSIASPDSTLSGQRLTLRQGLIAIAVGLAFWLAAALGIRFGTPWGVFQGLRFAVLIVATIPLTWLVIRRLRVLAALRPDQVLPGTVVATAAATLADAVAVAGFPGLYADEPAAVLAGLVWVFWGVACALGLAAWQDAREAGV